MSADTYRCGRCGMSFRIVEDRDSHKEWTSCRDCKLPFAHYSPGDGKPCPCFTTRADADWREGKAVAR